MELSDLPFELSDDGLLLTKYLAERNEVSTPEALLAFTNRWKAVWCLERDPTTAEKRSIVDGTYDPRDAWTCFVVLRLKGDCQHLVENTSCVGMHVVAPRLLLKASMLSKKFCVPFDVALGQMCGGFR